MTALGAVARPRPTVSVIIPTYNRRDQLLRTLESLARQTLAHQRFEVIVVDDGSTDETPAIARQGYPFRLRLVHQANRGATAARNLGAATSAADILVFMDDDVTVSPSSLQALAEACWRGPKILAMGNIHKRCRQDASVYTSTVLTMAAACVVAEDDVEFPFVDCNTELLACRRSDFVELGMFQDPTEGRGWPNWDDVDFGCRAHRNGFRLVGAGRATAEHWDHTIAHRAVACQRMYRAGRSAVYLFARYPELQTRIPMLADKTPIVWGQDEPRRVARKWARRWVSSRAGLGGLLRLVAWLEKACPNPAVLRRLYALLHGAYLYQGYQAGLRELEQQERQGDAVAAYG